ncbi:MAG: hypothetical protein K2O93_00885 [Oscillospiraceae bacterium]|nr:hypothetical protein [Oscillospiraceae bacterium]
MLSTAGKESAAGTQRAREAARSWLSYYNRILCEKGLITERERNRMALEIDKRQTPQRMI